MYYHYFKVIAESDTFAQGLNKIMNDELSEYPKTLNACSKYTLMPEVSRVHFEKKNRKPQYLLYLRRFQLDSCITVEKA